MTCQRDGERARKRARVKCGSERSARLARRARRDGGAAAARADLYHVRAATGARGQRLASTAAENETLRAQGPAEARSFCCCESCPSAGADCERMWRALLLFVSAAAFRASSPLARRRVPEVASRGQPLSTAALVETPPAPSAQGYTGAMRVGVVLLNLGGPERSEDVEPFLYNLFADPDIIRLPRALSGLQVPLAWAIARKRAPQSRAAYDSIGGGSPIVNYTRAQAQALEHALNTGPLGVGKGSGIEWRCYVAMRYWYPFTGEALQQAHADQCRALVVLPLYPHFSISTSGSSLRELGQRVIQDYGADFGQAHTVSFCHGGGARVVARWSRAALHALGRCRFAS